MRPLEYREDTQAIEVSFPAPVHLSSDHQRRLVSLIDEICDEYERHHPDRVMWAAGIGGRMLTNPFLVDDEHPLEFDMSVFSVECCERENYDFVPASADTLPKGHDAQQGLAGTESGAVPEGQTPNPSPSPAAGR